MFFSFSSLTEVPHGCEPTTDGLPADSEPLRDNHNHVFYLRQPPRVSEVVPRRPQRQEVGHPGLELLQQQWDGDSDHRLRLLQKEVRGRRDIRPQCGESERRHGYQRGHAVKREGGHAEETISRNNARDNGMRVFVRVLKKRKKEYKKNEKGIQEKWKRNTRKMKKEYKKNEKKRDSYYIHKSAYSCSFDIDAKKRNAKDNFFNWVTLVFIFNSLVVWRLYVPCILHVIMDTSWTCSSIYLWLF